MMKNFLSALCIAYFIQVLSIQLVCAQSKQTSQTLNAPPANVTIDGDLHEWGDSLRFYNADKKISYSLANDTGNIYVALRINDKKDQMRILLAGFTLSIDPKGRKKETFSMTFPAADPNDMPKLTTTTTGSDAMQQQDRDEMMQARLTKLRSIKVEGFKDVESEIITTSNTYGFKAAINLDADGDLVYEAAIPLKFFHANDLLKNEWAFNFKINGLSKPKTNDDSNEASNNSMGGGRGGMGGGGRGGMGGGGGRGGMGGGRGGNRGGTGSTEGKSADFWEKFYLAK